MDKKTLIFLTLGLFLFSFSDAGAQYNNYRILLFDRAPSVILNSNGEFRIDRFNQSVLELEVDYLIPNLVKENLTVRVRKMILTHVYNTRSGEIERSSTVLLDSATDLSINLKNWPTMLVQEILSDDEVYNTIYGKVQEGNKEVWMIIQPRARAR